MQFNTNNLSQPQMYTKEFSNFRGLDYTNAKLDIADNRSPDAQNFIFKDGINQKRNGYNQILKINSGGNFNGFWEFLDSNKKVHHIAHVGKKFYEITFEENEYLNTYKEIKVNYRPSIISLSEWTTYINNGIKDIKSYGVVRGDRLYIFCGIMLVYGSWDEGVTWELRAVRDNEDTYIPTTTTNIRHNKYMGNSYRASLEEVNMMSTYRINKLYGEKITKYEDITAEKVGYNNLLIQSKGGSEIAKNLFWSEGATSCIVINQPVYNAEEILFQAGNDNNSDYMGVMLKEGENIEQYYGKDVEGPLLNTLAYDTYFPETTKAFVESLYIIYTYKNNYLDMLVIVGNNNAANGNPTAKLNYTAIMSKVTYQLDATNISTDVQPVLTIEKNGLKTKYSSWDDTGYATGNMNVKLDFVTGVLTLTEDTADPDNPNPNIEIKFTTTDNIERQNYKKIDGCTFGIMFGYNGIEHLFVSGNNDYPNMDWHTSEALLVSGSTALPNAQNLTYFSDLSYAYLGNAQTKVMSYTLLNDNTLGILKEFSHNEPNLYVREPYFADALDPSGNVVYDFNGNAYQKLYYKQYMAAIGEGCVSTYATSNLSGDKLFLSENGLYGIELDYSNISSNQRYAKEKSRLINPVLEKYGKNKLKNATAISFQNRYYLSIDDEEGTVYIADARFRNSDASEMNDTMGYEWWCWKNVPAHIWFVDMQGNLGFGTKDGRLCLFNDENIYRDRNITPILSGGISYDKVLKKFILSKNYDIQNNSRIKFITNLEELIFNYSDVLTIEGNVIVCTSENLFLDYIIYLEDKEVILKRDSDIKCVITDLDYDIGGFKLKYADNGQEVVLAETDVVTKKLDTEYVAEYDDNNKEFTLLSLNGKENINLYGEIYNISTDLKAFIVEDKPVVAYWYTPYINFENSDFAKTLKYVTIIPEKVEHGSAKIELFTKTKSKNIEAFNVEGIDADSLLNNLNFSSFSIEIKDFAQSFSKKVKIKNFNFIVALMKSEDDKNFAVQNLTLTYVMGRRNKGVK